MLGVRIHIASKNCTVVLEYCLSSQGYWQEYQVNLELFHVVSVRYAVGNDMKQLHV